MAWRASKVLATVGGAAHSARQAERGCVRPVKRQRTGALGSRSTSAAITWRRAAWRSLWGQCPVSRWPNPVGSMRRGAATLGGVMSGPSSNETWIMTGW